MNRRGFTLLELSIVLTLIGIIISMGLVTFTGSLQASQYNKTVERMDNIEKALLNYATASNRIPCPSDLTLTATGSANYGMEAGAGAGSAIGVATGVCTGAGMLPQANFKASSGTVEGGVPTRALQLPDDYMYDGWGRKFRYAVDPTITKASALPYPVGGVCVPSTSTITVNDASGAARTTTGAYALTSHGANGHGAYTSNGTTINAASDNAAELGNCNCTSAGAFTGTYTPTYIEKSPAQDPSDPLDSFDDIVTFKEGWQLQAQNYPLAAKINCTFIYVGDYDNYRVVKFDQNGNFIANIGTGIVIGASGVATDSQGNVWVAPIYAGNQIMEFSSTGTWMASLGPGPTCSSCLCTISQAACAPVWPYGGSGQGQFLYPFRIFTDGSDNLWVTDAYNYRVQEFDKNGNFLQQIGTPGTGVGQMSNPGHVGIDTSGNLYVPDAGGSGSGQVQKYNSNTGAYLSVLVSGLTSVTTVAFDQSGNVLTLENYGVTIRKYNTSGTLLTSFSVSGSTNSEDMATDSQGNLYFVDTYANKVIKTDKNGAVLLTFGSPGSGNGQLNCGGYFCGIGVSSR